MYRYFNVKDENMNEKELNEKELGKIASGDDYDEVDVWTWCECISPGCNYENREYGCIPEGEYRICPACHRDTYRSKGIYEQDIY